MEAIDRLHTTAESHHRALIVEVMGRHAGWIALHAGHGRRRERDPHPREAVRHRAGLRLRRAAVPDPVRADRRGRRGRPPDEERLSLLDQRARRVRPRPARRRSASCWPSEIEKRTGKEARCTVLGHIQRGGTPDRVRPGARHPVRPARDRRGARRRVRRDGGAARHATSSGCRWPRPPASSSWCRRSATPRPRSSSADAAPTRSQYSHAVVSLGRYHDPKRPRPSMASDRGRSTVLIGVGRAISGLACLPGR